MRINVASKKILEKILERKKKDEFGPDNVDLKKMLKEILTWANRFVPSESGSILLDDPILNQFREKSGKLYFVACFGKGSHSIVDTTMPADAGIVGQAYSTGKPYISKKVAEDNNFYSAIDVKTKFRTRSIICAPVRINGVTIGVIELINRVNCIDYDSNDLTLLKIFAEYTSTLIQNSLDAKRFSELSIKDNLTGLYNDRFFYDRITKDITRAVRKGGDLGLLFLDLDRFKEVNDTHGHLAGSTVLSEMGGIILSTIEKIPNATSARYGGDEFIVILPDYSLDDSALYAENLRKTIEQFVFIKRKYPGGKRALNLKGQITSSTGVTSLLASGAKGTVRSIREELIKLADSAMYRSKEEGRNRITLAP
ncbi:MAG: diguanylate cyclase [Thermodesulfobacteriota bacterium]